MNLIYERYLRTVKRDEPIFSARPFLTWRRIEKYSFFLEKRKTETKL